MQINRNDFISFITVKQGLAVQSIRHCRIRFDIIQTWFADKELTKENVEKFFLSLQDKGLKNSSLNTYQFAFRQLVAYCKDRGLSDDFFEGFKAYKKTKPDIIIFTLEEIDRLLCTELKYGKFRGKDTSILDFRYRTLTMFLAQTGCRYGEASELRIKRLDISAGKATFIQTKTNENRTVFFTEPLKSDLKTLTEGRSQDDFVFRNFVEKQFHVADFSADLKRRAIKAGITKRTFPHNLRHSYITHLLEAGVPITEVASLVGHKDIQTTYSTYMHLADKTLQRAAMRHPSVRKNVIPSEIIRNLKELIDGQHFENDNRFDYEIIEGKEGLKFKLKVKG